MIHSKFHNWPAFATAIALLSAAPSQATLVTVNASGTIFLVGPTVEDVFSVGDPFTLTFSYESSHPAEYTTATEALYRAVTGYSLAVGQGASSYSGTGTSADLRIFNDSGANSLDAFQFDNKFTLTSASFPDVAGAVLQSLSLNISNLGGSPLDSTALPTSINPSDFSNLRFQMSWLAPDAYIQGTVTTLSFVPELASTALFGASGMALLLLRRRAPSRLHQCNP